MESKTPPSPKLYNLEERTYKFAVQVRDFTKLVPRSPSNNEYIKQLIRSSGSIAANYIEANESFSKKDYVMRVKICRKEAKETRLWLRLIDSGLTQQNFLADESEELMRIFGAIITKTSGDS